jgi:malonyl-CoA decarboxylase
MSAARTLFQWILNSIADRGLSLRGSLSRSSIDRLCQDLVSERGEASGTAIARAIAERYAALEDDERLTFLRSLLEPKWLADPEEILRLATAYHGSPTAMQLAKLFRTAEPRRQELFRRINMGPRGTETIVNLRRDLLALLPRHSELEPINMDLVHLLSSWFNRGFLELRRIDWRTPAIILERLIQYESVHEIAGWPDLRRRLQDDRRCFAFFHPALPEQPLIFVEIALTRGVPAAVQPLLDIASTPTDLNRVDTAAFYSISNCLEGLRNISFGAFLLKQVIHELESEDLKLRNFVTLSPIPGFRAWLTKTAPSVAEASPVKARKDQEQLLTEWCARYLTAALPNGRALDPVTNFHLSNGASIERINWAADTSPKGLRQSFGIMVNYSYKPWEIERNHEQYVKQRYFVLSDSVRSLLAEKDGPGQKSEKRTDLLGK